jgi:hypothetical protein
LSTSSIVIFGRRLPSGHYAALRNFGAVAREPDYVSTRARAARLVAVRK